MSLELREKVDCAMYFGSGLLNLKKNDLDTQACVSLSQSASEDLRLSLYGDEVKKSSLRKPRSNLQDEVCTL